MTIFSAPHPRFRIYTHLGSYTSLLIDLLFNRIIKGADVEKLEKAMAEKFRVSYAVAVPMAPVGILLTLKHLISPGQGGVFGACSVD